jgi:hypothetical protein
MAVLVAQKQLPDKLEELAVKLGVKWMVLPPDHFARTSQLNSEAAVMCSLLRP